MKFIITTISLLISLSGIAQWEKLSWDQNTNDISTENIQFFQYVDESSLFLIDSSNTLKIGSIEEDPLNHNRLTFENHALALPFNYTWATSNGSFTWWNSKPQIIGHINSDYSAYFIGHRDSVFVLFQSDDYSNWNLIADIPTPVLTNWEYFYPFNDSTFVLCNGNHVITSNNRGVTWTNLTSLDTNNNTNSSYRFYEDGKGVIVSDYDLISFTEDFGNNWKTYTPQDFGDEYLVFSEGFYKDGEIYAIGDQTVYSSWHNLIMKLDTLNKSVTSINYETPDYWPQSSMNRHIFFNEEHYYALNSEIIKHSENDTIKQSNLYVNHNNKLYPIFKEFEFQENYAQQAFSYTNDMTGHIFLHGDRFIRYNPEACSFIKLTGVDTQNIGGSFRNILFENHSGEFINYTGSMITTYNEDSLNQVAYAQTYGSPETLNSFTQSTLYETLNQDQYYGVVIDYNLGGTSCYFDYTPTEDHILGNENNIFETPKAYPNPTTGYIYFEGKAELLNLSGQIIDEGENLIDLSQQLPGVYFLRTLENTQRIIKQ